MRRLGLRVLAGGLAALMAVSAFAPAKVASAANDVLTAASPNAVNTLYITADMVDVDKEIVISGEKWDRIVVTKEAAANDIYFDEVEVGELVVESGSDANVQLWKVAAEQLTVKEPELKEVDPTALKALLTDDETRQYAVDLWAATQAENEKTMRKVPSIVTMEEAVVESLSTSANVRLCLQEGEVKNLTVESSAKQVRVNVTLEGYNGDLTYKGNDTFGVVNVKNVESRINKLTVEESTANNYLNVNSKDSVALKVEVAGDAKVALNIPMGELVITEAAKAAQVDILNSVDEMDVKADNAKIEVTAIGNVAQARVEGDQVKITGSGTLEEVVITGDGAYVSTKGTQVEGENTYVEPTYEEPKVVVRDIELTAGDGTTVTKNANGSSTISFSGQYKSAVFTVPATVDVDRIRSITLNITTSAQFGLSVLTKSGEVVNTSDQYPGYGISETTTKEFTYYVSPAEQKLARVSLMSLSASQPDLTLNSVTFTLYDTAPTPKPTKAPDAPGALDLPEGSKVYTFDDLAVVWGSTLTDAANGGKQITVTSQYGATRLILPEAITLGDYEKVILTMSSSTSGIGLELLDEENKVVTFWWDKKAKETTDIELAFNATGYGSGDSISADNLAKKIAAVNFNGHNEGAEVVVYRIAFVAKPGAGGTTPGGETTPTPTPGGEPTDTVYYEENFTADYFTGGSSWGVEKGLVTYKLAGLEVAGDAYEGDYCIKVKMNDVYNGIHYTLDNTDGDEEATFNFSVYLKATGVAGEEFVRMGVGNTYTDTSYWSATTTWTKKEKEVKVAAGEEVVLVFSAQDPQYCDAEEGQMACVYIDKVVITKN
ncbi:MAG: hypothetical protein J1E35_05635 [Lachnospiraceae bacterium]|nr:hypothetical protein [Lachnospiraceae bacterium]